MLRLRVWVPGNCAAVSGGSVHIWRVSAVQKPAAIYDLEQLEEFAAAPDLPDLTAEDLREVAALYARNFDLQPAAV